MFAFPFLALEKASRFFYAANLLGPQVQVKSEELEDQGIIKQFIDLL
jgi:hypothetical protein